MKWWPIRFGGRGGTPNQTDAPSRARESATTHVRRGNVLLKEGCLNGAAEQYRLAIDADKSATNAYVNLGFTLVQLAQLQEALLPLRQALRLDPRCADAHYLIGLVLLARREFTTAIAHMKQAIALKPSMLVVYRDLGKALHEIGQSEQAKHILRSGLTVDSECADLHYFMGNIELHHMELDAALVSYERALASQPEYAEVHNNKAQALLNLGEFAKAAAAARQALALDPSMHVARSNLLMTLSCDAQCSIEDYLTAARLSGQLFMAQVGHHAVAQTTSASNQHQDNSQSLRIGFVSGDLHNHPVGFFLDNVMGHWDSDLGMEAIAYSNDPGHDELTARLKARFHAWRDISAMDDEAAARQIAADRIDVLVDLSGHTPKNRLALFARRPASIQVSWLGYWASTGLPTMDWVLADPISVPASQSAHFTEMVWYLPHTRLCFTPPAEQGVPPVKSPPAQRNGYLTFGSFQRLTKLNDEVLTLWARVLHNMPESQLRLQSMQMKDQTARMKLLQRLQLLGIDAHRVRLVEASERLEYLAGHAEVDLILDTFPHNGATTTCEALWMGVPTLTLAGSTMLSRQGASLLTCAGLAEWVANSKDDFVLRAVRHANDLDALSRLRSGLREQVTNSALFDAASFTLNLQTALRGMWRKQVHGTVKP